MKHKKYIKDLKDYIHNDCKYYSWTKELKLCFIEYLTRNRFDKLKELYFDIKKEMSSKFYNKAIEEGLLGEFNSLMLLLGYCEEAYWHLYTNRPKLIFKLNPKAIDNLLIILGLESNNESILYNDYIKRCAKYNVNTNDNIINFLIDNEFINISKDRDIIIIKDKARKLNHNNI